jgi:hypothetical protein
MQGEASHLAAHGLSLKQLEGIAQATADAFCDATLSALSSASADPFASQNAPSFQQASGEADGGARRTQRCMTTMCCALYVILGCMHHG